MDEQLDRIYVGYLAMPRRYAAHLKLVVPLLIGATLGLGTAIALTSRDPGSAVWETELSSYEGVLHEMPYPYLETPEGPLLLVEAGKFGSADRFTGLEGASIRVEGALLQRGTWRAIEVAAHESIDGLGPMTSFESVPVEVLAVGEILDSKCYLGAMKPGDGRTHRACAILCIRGGIPPLFVGKTSSGQAFAAVITGEEGTPNTDALVPFVGRPIEIRGTNIEEHGLPVLRLDASDITHTHDSP